MPDSESPPVFEAFFPDQGINIRCQTPDELVKWNQEEWNQWQWIMLAQPYLAILQQQVPQGSKNQIEQLAQEWRQQNRNTAAITNIFGRIQGALNARYNGAGYLSLSKADRVFLLQLRQQKGDLTAAGAYASVIKAVGSGQLQVGFVEGILTGFLYKNEIDWTAGAHKQILTQLQQQYEEQIHNHEARFQQLEKSTVDLTAAFDAGLKTETEALENLQKERSETFQGLHDGQVKEFDAIKTKHLEELKAIEKTFTEKLALQAPVQYWKDKAAYHRLYSKVFGWIALATGVMAIAALTWLVHWAFGYLKAGEDPKHWQFAVLILGAFFSIWLVRVFVRLFFSHVHLATDAAERSVMIQTFISLQREGPQFAPDDKKIILEHLFRTASDGLVKDDAAPPGIWELFTRR